MGAPIIGKITCQSSGTVSIRVDISGTPTSCLLFIPDCDHYVKHKEKDYAAFVDKDNDKIALLHEYKENGIQIEFGASDPLISSMLAAAHTNKHKVTIGVEIEVSVEIDGGSIQKLGPITVKALTAIEFPAK